MSAKLPAPFDTIIETHELPFAQLAHQIRDCLYGSLVDYQETVAWRALVAALESHRRQRLGWADEADAHRALRERMSTALNLDREADDGAVTHELDADELVSVAEECREEADQARECGCVG